MPSLPHLLSGGDLRSIGKTNEVVPLIKTREDFEELFVCLFHTDRKVQMRAADGIEKVTVKHPEFLEKHTEEIFKLCESAENKELQWHLAQLLPRLQLDTKHIGKALKFLMNWVKDSGQSKIVRVNSIQALFDLSKQHPQLKDMFMELLQEVEKENVPSVNARIRKLKKQIRF